jgi:hypothetical protein
MKKVEGRAMFRNGHLERDERRFLIREKIIPMIPTWSGSFQIQTQFI